MMRYALALLLLAIGPVTVVGGEKADAKGLSWVRGDGSLTLKHDGEIVWRFNFGADRSKPFFHPVNLPGAATLTWEAPPDHPWHHGIWFSWKLINGVNYWEENRKTRTSAGRTTWNEVMLKQRADHSARFVMDLKYHPPGKPPVLTEHRVLEVSPPAADGGYHIDWTAKFTAKAKKVVLDRTPLPNEPNGRGYGGYAGLSVRLAKKAAHFEAADSEQQIKRQDQQMRLKARAVDYAGAIGKTTGGIAILDHPQNLNAPSPWYITRNMGTPMTYFSPAVIHDGPHTLAGGESFTLRYRILVHPDSFDATTLRKHYQQFIKPPKQ